MSKNNHNPFENQIFDYCRNKIEKEKKVIKYIKKNKYILEQLGYEITKKEISDISE